MKEKYLKTLKLILSLYGVFLPCTFYHKYAIAWYECIYATISFRTKAVFPSLEISLYLLGSWNTDLVVRDQDKMPRSIVKNL